MIGYAGLPDEAAMRSAETRSLEPPEPSPDWEAAVERRWDEIGELHDWLLEEINEREQDVKVWEGDPDYTDPPQLSKYVALRCVLKDGRVYTLGEYEGVLRFESSIQQLEEVGSGKA